MIKSKNKRLFLKISIVLIFLSFSFYFLQNSNLNNKFNVIIKFKSTQTPKIKLQLFSKENLQDEITYHPRRRFKKLKFNLSFNKSNDLRISFGTKPGTIAIRSITIYNYASKHVLNGKEIYKLFKNTNFANKPYLKNGVFYMKIEGSNNWLAPEKQLYDKIEKCRVAIVSSYLFLILLSIVLLFFLHYFDPGQLQIFFSKKNLYNGVLIILLLLVFPLFNEIANIKIETKLEEQRKITRKPAFSFESFVNYSKQYTAYYNDNFIFRNTFVFLRNLMKYKFFDQSGTSKVIIGKKGWLFLGDFKKANGTIAYFRSIKLLTINELENWKNQIEFRWKWLQKKGIHYLFILAPNKNTIYPEYMPDNFKKFNSKSRMDQLFEYLKVNSQVPFLDLRPALKNGKKNYPVYSRTDTHWTDYGGYLVYREIIRYLQSLPEFKDAYESPISNYNIRRRKKTEGDLSKILSIDQEIFKEKMIKLSPIKKWNFKSFRLHNLNIRQYYTKNINAKLPPVLMVHDSFYKKIQPFLSEQLSLIRYIWDWDTKFYPAIINEMKPKLVIDEIAERFLMKKF